MVTTILILVLVVGLIVASMGADPYGEGPVLALIGFVLCGYAIFGLLAHHVPSYTPKDFTAKELTQDAYSRGCSEVILRADYTPTCVNKYRENEPFTTKVESSTLWPLDRWAKQHTVDKYRPVTRNDLDTACDNVVHYSACQQSGTIVIVLMESKES